MDALLGIAATVAHLFIIPLLGLALVRLVPALPKVFFKEL